MSRIAGCAVCLVYYLDDLAFSSEGPGAGVGGRGGGRGRVWGHAAQGARPAELGHHRAPHSLWFCPVPHSEGAQAKGRHPGASGHPPAGP